MTENFDILINLNYISFIYSFNRGLFNIVSGADLGKMPTGIKWKDSR